MRLISSLKIGVAFLSLAFWDSNASDLNCPSTLYPEVCDTLQSLDDTEWVYCTIILNTQSFFGGSDTGCNKVTDSTCITRPPDTTGQGITAETIAATRSLFESYDLRWPDDLETRAAVPSEDRRMDTITYTPHHLSVGYYVYATKASILSIGEEPYTKWVARAYIPQPAMIIARPIRGIQAPFRKVPVNIKGQRIPETPANVFRIDGQPGNR